MTSPEQSKASGPVPPHRYGLPICFWAKAIAVDTTWFGTAVDPLITVPASWTHAAVLAAGLPTDGATEKPPLA